MATAEQMQEVLQQQQHELQVLGARIAALQTQLQIESARAQTAEQERSALIHTLVTTRQDRGNSMVDTKGIGQPFTLKGGADDGFGEWTHKVRTLMLARFGDEILTAVTWAARQQRIVVKTCVASQRNRMLSWITVFGEQAGEDEIENIDDIVGKLYAYLVSFTSDAANRIVRTSGEGNGLEAWRRLHSKYDPTSSTRRVAMLQQVQIPPRCERVEDLGPVLEKWLSKKRQHEMFTDRNGRPCRASDDTLVAAMFRLMPKSLEESVMFANDVSRICTTDWLAYGSTQQSIRMSERKETTEKDDPMDVDALSKGKSKGKGKKGSSGKGKGQQRSEQHEQCRVLVLVSSVDTTRKTVDKSGGQEAKVGQKQVRRVTTMLMDAF